eukprot:3918950-Rhodomonas_salina.2
MSGESVHVSGLSRALTGEPEPRVAESLSVASPADFPALCDRTCQWGWDAGQARGAVRWT